MQLLALPGLSAVPADLWDALCPADSPFLEHRFLIGLEQTGCVGGGTGWMPLHLLVVDSPADLSTRPPGTPLPAGTKLLAAAPSYVKTHSYGEFIFDWRWAEAFHSSGRRYYPKLVVATPFTPVTGQRLLMAPGCDQDAAQLLGGGLIALAQQIGASSVHWLFTRAEEAEQLAGVGYVHRLSHQNHWVDAGYGDFDGFLASMRSRARKQIRRERRKGQSHGLTLTVERGDAMNDDAWQAIRRLYRQGCHRYGSPGYLTDAFFDWLQAELPERVVCSLAQTPGATGPASYVAGTLNFQRGQSLYGRYWGCDEELDHLHFELAFYQLIEHCLRQGWTRFEAGAGGDHKVRRGLQPTLCHSAHWVADPEMRSAIGGWVDRERAHVTSWLDELAAHGTGRRPHLE